MRVQNLSLSYDGTPVLDGVDFCLGNGQIGCLLGASGCGKTSILRCILGFETPSDGEIYLDRALFSQKNGINIAPDKRGVGVVFQDHALFWHLNVAQNVGFGIKDSARVNQMLALTELDHLKQRPIHALSGGQMQRVALARTLAMRPKFVLLDEPFSSLDTDLRRHLASEVKAMLKAEGIGALMVTHDEAEAFAMADMLGVMQAGKLLDFGTPMNVYSRPRHVAVAKFLGDGALLDIISLNGDMAMTTAGEIFCPNAPFMKGATVVLVRPDDVSLSPDDTGTPITHKTFVYGQWRYTLQNGLVAKSTKDYPLHTRVKAAVLHGWGLL